MAPSVCTLTVPAIMALALVPANESHFISYHAALVEVSMAYNCSPTAALELMELSKNDPLLLDEHHRLSYEKGIGWHMQVIGLEAE